MPLHVDSQGLGPDLVLLHGWGLHGGIWRELIAKLAHRFTVYTVDLPGHGDSAFTNEYVLDAWVDAVSAVTPEKADWIGWSLGGLIATRLMQRHTKKINRLLLLASNPCFIHKPNWDTAVEFDVFSRFADELESDFEKVLLRFLALQVMGSRQARATLKSLRGQLLEKPAPDPRALQAGLEILRATDLRSYVSHTQNSVYWLSGERDTLVPHTAAKFLLPNEKIHIIEQAGHAPFISHPDECVSQIVKRFG